MDLLSAARRLCLCLGLCWPALAISLPAQIVPHALAGEASIQVEIGQADPGTIPRTLFGSFLEPIGNSTYNGLWAELLENPSFEAGLWDLGHIQARMRAEPELLQASQLGLPLPWLPLNPSQGNRYEFRYGDAANSARSLELMGVAGSQTGILERVFLPAERELTYQGSLYVRHLSGSSRLTVSLVGREGAHAELASARLDASARVWTRLPFTLTIADGSLARLEQAEFRIALDGDGRVLLDQVSLMPADALDGLDPEMVAAARELHTPLVRYGGNFTSGYHWRDGIGPRDQRVSMPNLAWGIPEYNTFGTDEFLHFCQLIDAQPQIAVNLGSGTPEEAAAWVDYVNAHWAAHEGGLLWELGNELWGSWNTGWPTLAELAPRTLAFSRAIRAADPKARLIATGQDPDHFEPWNALQLANPVGTENYISTHFVETTTEVRLPQPSGEFVVAATLALPVELERRLAAMRQQIDNSPQKQVKIAFTEWLWYKDEHQADRPGYDNLAGALTTASMFNMLIRSSDQVPISDMTGIIEFAGIWKKRGVVYRTPAAYVLSMFAGAPIEHRLKVRVDSGNYSVHNGSTRLPDIEGVPYLDVDAAISRDGSTVTLFVVNRVLERDLPAQIRIPGIGPGGRAQAQTLAAPSLYAGNDEIEPQAVVPASRSFAGGPAFRYVFPRASFTVITLSR